VADTIVVLILFQLSSLLYSFIFVAIYQKISLYMIHRALLSRDCAQC